MLGTMPDEARLLLFPVNRGSIHKKIICIYIYISIYLSICLSIYLSIITIVYYGVWSPRLYWGWSYGSITLWVLAVVTSILIITRM